MEDRKIVVKDPETGEEKEMTLTFMPGCFDELIADGVSQEEIEGIIKEVAELFASGEAQKNAVPVEWDKDDLSE